MSKRPIDEEDLAGGDDALNSYAPQPHSAKRRRTYTEADAKLAKIYEDLASDDAQARVSAAIDLVHKCLELVKSSEDADREAFSKIQIRLIRGLCSNRKGARIGFSLAFTEVLHATAADLWSDESQNIEVHVETLLKLIKDQAKADYASAQEKRNYLIGRMFAYNCIIRSKVLLKDESHATGLPMVIREVCELGKQASSSWLKEECGLVCYEAARLLCSELPNARVACSVIDAMNECNTLKTPEGILVWLELSSRIDGVARKFPKGIWHKHNPLSGKETGTVVKILHFVKSSDEDTSDPSGSRQTSPHFAWDVILQHLMRTDGPRPKGEDDGKAKALNNYKQFWAEAIDNTFFAPTASPERKAVGFQVFEKVVSKAPIEYLTLSFSPKLMKCLINHSASTERYLHAAAKRLLDAFVARAKYDEVAAPVIFRCIVKDNGALAFDQITKSNTITSILQSVEAPALATIVETYKQLIERPIGVDKEQASNAARNLVADQLVSLVRTRCQSDKLDSSQIPAWLRACLDALLSGGFAAQDPDDEASVYVPKLSQKSQVVLRTRLASCLAIPMNTAKSSTDAMAYLQHCIHKLNKINVITLAEADPQVVELIKDSSKLIQQDINNKIMTKSQADALRLILAMTIFQAYDGEAEAANMLNELLAMFESFEKARKRGGGLPKQVMTSVTEMILALCSQTTALHRRVAELAFGDLASLLTSAGLSSMLDVLEQQEGLQGQQALFSAAEEAAEGEDGTEDEEDDSADDEAEDDESDEENDEEEAAAATNGNFEIVDVDDEDSDIEIVNGELVDHNEDDETSDDASSSSEEEDGEVEEVPDELTEFERKLASILNVPGNTSSASKGNKNDDDAASTTTDSSMGSSQMEELDTHLSAIFKQRAQSYNSTSTPGSGPAPTKAQTQRRAKENIVNFKNRVLDLLSIYLKAGGHKDPKALDCILPLLRCMRETRETQIRNKAGKVLVDSFITVAKKKGMPAVSTADAAEIDGEVLSASSPSSDDDDATDDEDNSEDDEDASSPELSASNMQRPGFSLLSVTLEELVRFPSRDHAKAASRACLFLARCLLTAADTSSGSTSTLAAIREKIAQLYEQAHARALDEPTATDAEKDPSMNGGQTGKKAKKDKKKQKDSTKQDNIKVSDQVRALPDWQEAVWREWQDFEKQTRRTR